MTNILDIHYTHNMNLNNIHLTSRLKKYKGISSIGWATVLHTEG